MINLKNSFLDFSLFGIGINNLSIIFIIFILSILIRGLFAKIVIFKIKKIINKTSNKIDDKIFNTLVPPLKLLPIIFFITFVSYYIKIDSSLGNLFGNIIQSLFTIFIFWFLYRLIEPLSYTSNNLEKIISKALVNWIFISIKYFIFFIGTVAILEIWGIKVGPIIAGLGLFGVAVALGAQDLFKNLISGVLIIIEKRFNIGDLVEIQGQDIGTVELIGFRSTLIRKFDTTVVSIPNYILSESSIINYTSRKYRRLDWILGLEYTTSFDQLKNISSDISNLIINDNKNYIVNEQYPCNINIHQFNESSIDIRIICYTNTSEWNEYLNIKEELILNLKKIIEIKHKASFAYPSRKIYFENSNTIFNPK